MVKTEYKPGQQPVELSFSKFAEVYCKHGLQTPEGLKQVLGQQKANFSPEGWMLLQCVDMSSSMLGTQAILPYGPNNTYKALPDRPISPRGLASDMSTVVAVLPAAELEGP
jgi:hypothetical protein